MFEHILIGENNFRSFAPFEKRARGRVNVPDVDSGVEAPVDNMGTLN